MTSFFMSSWDHAGSINSWNQINEIPDPDFMQWDLEDDSPMDVDEDFMTWDYTMDDDDKSFVPTQLNLDDFDMLQTPVPLVLSDPMSPTQYAVLIDALRWLQITDEEDFTHVPDYTVVIESMRQLWITD